MAKSNPICRRCGIVLDSENWFPSHQKGNRRICKECERERLRRWREANPEKHKANYTRSHRKQGDRPHNENKECTMYLGVHIAEKVLSRVFKDVEVMPMNHPGFDFICNHGKKIDVKSSCLGRTKYPQWGFHIDHNTTADFFLCLAFDNRDALNPLHIWLLPGNKVNHLTTATISPNTVSRWDEYALDISEINECCVAMSEK